MASSRLAPWVCLLVCVLSVLETESVDVTNTIVKNAVAKGAGNLICINLMAKKLIFLQKVSTTSFSDEFVSGMKNVYLILR